jgi:hypothetical protein
MFKKRADKSEKGANKWRKIEEVVLPTAKLRFCPEQLQNLNYIFQRRLQQKNSVESGEQINPVVTLPN